MTTPLTYSQVTRMLLDNRDFESLIIRGESDSELVVTITHALRDPKWGVRSRAVGALGRIGDVSAVPALIRDALNANSFMHEDWAGAARSLGDIAGKHPEYDWSVAIGPLKECLKRRGNTLRMDAAVALGMMGDTSGVPLLVEGFESSATFLPVLFQRYAVKAFGRIAKKNPGYGWSPVVPLLSACLKEHDLLRRDAAQSLAEIAENSGIDLKPVRQALLEYVDSVRKEGDSIKTWKAEREATAHYLLISKAATRFRAGLPREDGVILLGERPRKPPLGRAYRSQVLLAGQ